MPPLPLSDLQVRIDLLERRLRRTQRTSLLASACLIAVLVAGFGARLDGNGAAPAATPDTLTARALIITDENGVGRVRLGAPLPDPIVGGETQPRIAPISGMLLYDADGEERAGFATADGDSAEVFIGLDSKEQQVALFLANAYDGANLQVFDAESNRIGMWAVGGSANMVVINDGETLFQLPDSEQP